MKINCCWLYAISKYGYPPSIADTQRALGEMAALGFNAVELEGVREENLRAVWAARADLQMRCDDLGLRVINFCPVLPDLVSADPSRRRAALDLFRLAVEVASFFGAPMVQVNSYAPPVEFISQTPYGETLEFSRQFDVRIPDGFAWERTWATLVEATRRCTAIARDAGLLLCLEPRVGELVSNTDALLRLSQQVDDPGFGVVRNSASEFSTCTPPTTTAATTSTWRRAAAPWTGRGCSGGCAVTASMVTWGSTSATCPISTLSIERDWPSCAMRSTGRRGSPPARGHHDRRTGNVFVADSSHIEVFQVLGELLERNLE